MYLVTPYLMSSSIKNDPNNNANVNAIFHSFDTICDEQDDATYLKMMLFLMK